MGTTMNGGAGMLAAPERNNFYYGKLMDVAQFEKEQRYFNRKRLLLNRLVLGSGVVCGLNVVPGANGHIRIEPGAALDELGREIIVPEVVEADPHQLTDDQGNPVGDPITAGTVSICLAYAETCTDLMPVLEPDCDTPGNCAPGTLREGYRILVRAEGDAAEPPTCGFDEFPLPTKDALHELLCGRVNLSCPVPPAAPCVPLARVTLDGDDIDEGDIDACTGRPLVYGNALLYELILCLAERVEQCCAAMPGDQDAIQAPAIQAPAVQPPAVVAIWPPNAARLSPQSEDETLREWYEQWQASPHLEITFDREMFTDQLVQPAPWLRVWMFRWDRTLRRENLQVQPIDLVYDGRGTAAFSARYRLDDIAADEAPIRYLVQIRAEGNTIVSAQGLLLDADFAGTGLTQEQLGALWQIQTDTRFARRQQSVWDGLVAAHARLPSGDGLVGGRFHSWFQTAPEEHQ
jgi:hypothetical protein